MSDLNKLIFLVAEGCKGCDALKKAAKGKVKIMDVSKEDEATKLAMDNKIYSVPTAIYKDKNKVEKCNLEYTKDKVIVKCGGRKIEIDK